MIVPLFALANAGVHITGGLLSDAVTSPITIGIVAGYVVGKPLGIFLLPWLATRAPVRKMVGGGKLTITFPGLLGTGTAAGRRLHRLLPDRQPRLHRAGSSTKRRSACSPPA